MLKRIKQHQNETDYMQNLPELQPVVHIFLKLGKKKKKKLNAKSNRENQGHQIPNDSIFKGDSVESKLFRLFSSKD